MGVLERRPVPPVSWRRASAGVGRLARFAGGRGGAFDMILFCGITSEPPLAMAIEAAQACGLPHVVFNQRHAFFYDVCIDAKADGNVSGVLRVDECDWPLDEFTGV